VAALRFREADETCARVFRQLYEFGGFPEPFLSRDRKTLRRFHNQRLDQLVKEDIRDVEAVRDLSALQVLVELLPERVGSLLSLNSLREDLQVAHKTVALWVEILERFYYHFRLYPFLAKGTRSLRKEPKLYLWDWSQLTSDARRLENMIAAHLLKTVHFLYDAHGHRAELYFLRDTEGREVDFLVTVDRKPWFMVEVKSTFRTVSRSLRYFQKKLHVPFAYQVVREVGQDFFQEKIRVISVEKFLTGTL